jgi:hypothetical protein
MGGYAMKQPPTIAEIMIRLSDRELLEALPYIRDENGERVSLIELKHILRETVKEVRRK